MNTLDVCKSTCEMLRVESSIAVDLEGEQLGRTGPICILTVGRKDGSAYLFDIVTLGVAAFENGGLRALLEDARVMKLMYDGRSDADALFHQFNGVRIRGAADLQVRRNFEFHI